MSQQKIANRLKSLEEILEVSVVVTGTSAGTIRVTHARHHALEFVFRWSTDHFIGYFVDSAGAQSQAVVSLYSPLDAIKFVSAYVMLTEIRSNQKGS